MKRKLSLVLCALLLTVLFAACSDGGNTGQTDPIADTEEGGTTVSTEDTTAASGSPGSSRDTIRRVSSEAFDTTDPHYRTKIVDGYIIGLIYETFYFINERMEEFPQLATGYDISEDGMTYTYHLKQGVQFQTGGEMTSSDVRYSFERADKSPNTMTYTQRIERIETPDDYTVVFHLSELDPVFHINACNVAILSEQAMENVGNGFTTELPGGTGAYTLVEWKGDEKILLQRNENYHGDAPAIEFVEYLMLPDTTAALMAFEAGQIDYSGIPKADWERIESSGNWTTDVIYSNHTTYLAFNCQKAPFDDPLVRQAFSYAVLQDEILTACMEDLGMTAYFMGNPDLIFGLPSYDEVTIYEYNPDKARELLAQAGYPDGLTLDDTCWTFPTGHFNTVAEVIHSQLAEVGIHFELEIVDTSVYVTDMVNGNHLLGIMGMTINFDAGYFSRCFATSGIGDLNLSYYSNPRVDELFELASKSVDQDYRAQQFKEAYQIITEEAVILPFYHQASCIAWDKDLNADPYTLVSMWSWN